MRVQVLIATMNQVDHSLLKKMNISTSAIIGNQTNFDLIERFNICENEYIFLNLAERGVGLNRNNALARATADYCLFADDDMVYVDNYSNIVISEFENNPKADVLIFNLEEKDNKRYKIKKKIRINRFNYLRYGTARIAIRTKSIIENGIFFNQCFGGGTPHSHGEDNLFLTACLNSKLNIYGVPLTIAKLSDNRDSTWNKGYDSKYLYDQGFLYKKISRKWYKLLCLQDAIRRRKSYKMSFVKAYKMMIRGSKLENVCDK